MILGCMVSMDPFARREENQLLGTQNIKDVRVQEDDHLACGALGGLGEEAEIRLVLHYPLQVTSTYQGVL